MSIINIKNVLVPQFNIPQILEAVFISLGMLQVIWLVSMYPDRHRGLSIIQGNNSL